MVAVAKSAEIIGVIGLKDPLRSDSGEIVEQLRNTGVTRIALVTGDSEATAQEVADEVGISAASEGADVVIVEDSISHLAYAILIAKNSRRKALQAAGVGMGLSLFAMLAGALGITSPRRAN